MVCDAFSLEKLTLIFKHDPMLSKSIVSGAHGLFLALMADQSFKMTVAKAYADAFLSFSYMYGLGIGTNEFSVFGISVQFLNRSTFVNEIVEKHTFLSSISYSLRVMLESIGDSMNHFVLQNRRYNPLLGDLKIILSLPEISRHFVSHSCFEELMSVMKRFQHMDKQSRQLHAHIEIESRDWMHAFNLYLGLTSLFDYFVNWFISCETSDTGLFSVDEFLELITNSLLDWQAAVVPTANFIVRSCIPILITEKTGIGVMEEIPSNIHTFLLHDRPRDFSFHIFLHRLLSTAIREISKHSMHNSSLTFLQSLLSDSIDISLVIDFPLLDIIWASEIKIGMWRRNGQMIKDQLLNYADPPFCRSFRDLDLMLIQFMSTVTHSNYLLNHILNRFQLVDYLQSIEPMSDRRDRDYQYFPVLLEEFLLLVTQIVTELPLPPGIKVDDKDCQNAENASKPPQYERLVAMMKKEIIHKLATGAKTFSQLQDCHSLVVDFDKVLLALITSGTDFSLYCIAFISNLNVYSFTTDKIRCHR